MEKDLTDLKQLVEAIRSGDARRQLPALTEASQIVRSLVEESVNALVDSPARHPVADRLATFGPLVVPALERLLERDVDAEAKTYAATVLLHVGSKAGVNHLLTELPRKSEATLMIAISLGKAGVVEAAGMIESLLNQWDVRMDPPGAMTLIGSLRRLGGSVSTATRARIESEATEPYRTALLKTCDGN